MKTNLKNKFLMSTLLGVAAIGGIATPVSTHAATPNENLSNIINNQSETTKYPNHVMKAVRVNLGLAPDSTELDNQINSMSKVQVMDTYLTSFGKKANGQVVRNVVKDVFNIDLDSVSKNNYGSKLNSYEPNIMESLRQSLGGQSNATELDEQIMAMPKAKVMDAYIKLQDNELTAAEDIELINNIFGVNLNGISGLEHAQLSIYSKGQWVIQDNHDLFVVSSSLDDVSVYVSATDYYKQLTGSQDIPNELSEALIEMGYSYNADTNQYTYTNPTGESVSDAYKTQTIGAVINTIKTVNTGFTK